MDQVIFNTHDVVLLMTAYQCILFAILLFTLRNEFWLRNTLLALFLLQHAAIPLDILINFGAEFRNIALSISPNLFYVFDYGYWLEGPLLLWYTRSLIYKSYQLTWKDTLYLLPAAAYLIYQFFFYYSLDMDLKRALQEGYSLHIAPQYMNYVSLFREVFRTALGVLCLVELTRYRKHLKRNYSDIEKLDLSWLTLLVTGFLLIRAWSVLVVFFVMLAIMYGVQVNFEIMGLLGNYTTFVLISVLIFFSLRHSSICEGMDQRYNDSECAEEPPKIQPQQAARLTRAMEEEKLYLTPLTLDRLAEHLSLNPRTVSTIINRHFHCNFFEFVNSYRVEEAKRLLACEGNDKSVLNIMYDVGFNSKATFNTLFKRKVGMTPTDYRKKVAQAQLGPQPS
ncbi:AraC family transcriptional regulator [Marinimicrobium sp. ABcell2]|uniref:helix-turn-helix domain-containing protein n=1 Tax=Marinimicrobium sp. ABcell2 TaxID=3069751 RepID=UPI0027B64A26|nr:AraC family transcriptional regulator [Marinimicrobium sp. ABcell2]MDQ2078134.1 AraC family transcriptional regulator [Marinimicrobium sp. ABcell2]